MTVASKPGRLLSPRETEVLSLVSKGFTNLQIGKMLGVAECTVAEYMRSVVIKLEVSNRVEAACRAVREGII